MNYLLKHWLKLLMKITRPLTIFEKYDLDFCCKGKRSLQRPVKKRACPLKQLQKS